MSARPRTLPLGRDIGRPLLPMTPSRRSWRVMSAIVALALLAGACSEDEPNASTTGDGVATDDSTSVPETTADDGATTTEPGASTTEAEPEPGGTPVVFSGQGNHLDAYSTEPPFEHQRVSSSAAEDPENGLDLNAQLCFFHGDDGTRYLIAGEDTDQDGAGTQGWGIFEVEGSAIGDFAITQVAKLTPTFQGEDNPENYGCAVLSDGRIVTGDVGNQALGDATGQLIMYFPPYNSFTDIAYCKLDVEIGTAQQILVDADDNIYISSSLGRTPERPAGVYKFSPPYPTGNTAETGCGQTDATGAPMADEVTREVFINTDDGLAFPAGLVASPTGGFFVASVANGVINEYDADGTFVQNILSPPEGEELDADGYSTGSPLGLGLGPDNTLYYADIGVVRTEGADFLTIGPGNNTGSVRRITFTDTGEPNPPETLATDLAFPDGIGIFVP